MSKTLAPARCDEFTQDCEAQEMTLPYGELSMLASDNADNVATWTFLNVPPFPTDVENNIEESNRDFVKETASRMLNSFVHKACYNPAKLGERCYETLNAVSLLAAVEWYFSRKLQTTIQYPVEQIEEIVHIVFPNYQDFCERGIKGASNQNCNPQRIATVMRKLIDGMKINYKDFGPLHTGFIVKRELSTINNHTVQQYPTEDEPIVTFPGFLRNLYVIIQHSIVKNECHTPKTRLEAYLKYLAWAFEMDECQTEKSLELGLYLLESTDDGSPFFESDGALFLAVTAIDFVLTEPNSHVYNYRAFHQGFAKFSFDQLTNFRKNLAKTSACFLDQYDTKNMAKDSGAMVAKFGSRQERAKLRGTSQADRDQYTISAFWAWKMFGVDYPDKVSPEDELVAYNAAHIYTKGEIHHPDRRPKKTPSKVPSKTKSANKSKNAQGNGKGKETGVAQKRKSDWKDEGWKSGDRQQTNKARESKPAGGRLGGQSRPSLR